MTSIVQQQEPVHDATGVRVVSETTALMFCGEDELPPTCRQQPLPGGWHATGEVLDFRVGGGWVEAWLLTKHPTT